MERLRNKEPVNIVTFEISLCRKANPLSYIAIPVSLHRLRSRLLNLKDTFLNTEQDTTNIFYRYLRLRFNAVLSQINGQKLNLDAKRRKVKAQKTVPVHAVKARRWRRGGSGSGHFINFGAR